MHGPNGTPKSLSRRTAVDLYCGAGGTSTGAAQAGVDVRYGLDYDKNAVASFSANHPDAYGDCRDVAAVTGKEILELARTDRIDYLLSGPNCQAVSTMGLFYDADPRNLLFVHLARLVEEFRKLGVAPRNVIIENVPGIAFQRNVRYIRELFGFLLRLNTRIIEHVDREHRIGHSYFLDADDRPIASFEDLVFALKYRIIPLLQDYTLDDFEVLGEILGAHFVDLDNQNIKIDAFGSEDSLKSALTALLSV